MNTQATKARSHEGTKVDAYSVIADQPPRDGREWECQCAHCGSSCDWHECQSCDDGFDGHDCGEDTCCCARPEDNVPCDICGGDGGWWVCMSGGDWCDAHPLPGRESIDRGQIEWFTFDDLPAADSSLMADGSSLADAGGAS